MDFIWEKLISNNQSIGVIEYPTTRIIAFKICNPDRYFQIKVYYYKTETSYDLNDIIKEKIVDKNRFTEILREAENFVEVNLVMST